MRSVDIDLGIAPLLRIGVVPSAPVEVGPAGTPLRTEIQALVARLIAAYAGRAPAEIEGLAPARRLYRAFGIDPTSTRPSSEALVRRILQGKPFPEVNAAVDVGNLCSATCFLPIGLYDAAKIRGEILLRRGAPGESYPGIRKDQVHVAGRPVLADAEGPFGNPTSDSARTSVDARTTELIMVIFGPADLPPSRMEEHVEFASGAISRHLRTGGSGA